MNTSIIAGSLIAALSLAAPLHGQQVAVDVVLRTGPVAGHVVVNGYSTYHRPAVVYRRAPARVIVVERISRRPRGHVRDGWKRGYRAVTLREVVVYERDGRFYRDADGDDGGR
jgi:hypothetical protein